MGSCSDSVRHNRVQVLSIPVMLLACITTIMYDFFFTCAHIQISFSDKHLKKPGGNNNKDEDNSPKNLNDKNQQASSQKFRQLIKMTF